MAEEILSGIAGKILESLGKAALQEAASWLNARDDLGKLEETVRMINACLLDAEKRQAGGSREAMLVREWLRRLKQVLYRADDLFDEVITIDKQKQLMMMEEGGIKLAKQVRLLFSRSGLVLFRRKIAHEIKSTREELDVIKSDMSSFNFVACEREKGDNGHARQIYKRETGSSIQPDDVVGRLNDKRAIIEMLLAEPDEKSHVSVIPIVGFGGCGKTTLAQLVFNDEEVWKQFDMRKWVCVPEVDNPTAVVKKVFKSFTDKSCDGLSLDQLQSGIKEAINNKKYLLVLDDIWDESRHNWLNLMSLLRCGSRGSKIIVTTRSNVVAEIAGTIPKPYELGLLSQEESWNLFRRLAFKPGQEESSPRLVEIGKEIVRKCKNVPLAIRVVGSSIYSLNERDWVRFRDVELSKLGQSGHTDVMDVLKLSYDHLPSELKPCFAYCALFPKDRVIEKEALILLWAAQGYIRLTNQSDSLHDAGDGYFEELLRRNMLQDVIEDEYSGEVTCKMHDLVHDLATFVVDNEILLVDTSPSQPHSHDKLLRHVNLYHGIYKEWEASPSMLQSAGQMRSFFVHEKVGNREKMVSSFTCMRALHLDTLECVPNCIGRLRHLRYLDLSWGGFHHLPRSITMLCNLQTLILYFCLELKELPTGFWKLADLRHLNIDECHALTDMPAGFGKLTSLEHLGGWFRVGERNGVDALAYMNLRGKLDPGPN